MNLFCSIKSTLTTRIAAEYYGIQVKRNGMCRCPFHNDKTPSMKVDKRFHCFGCQADGDVINFTARLFNLSQKDAALKLAADFGIAYDEHVPIPVKPKQRFLTEAEIFERRFRACFGALTDEFHRLEAWRIDYAPQSPDEEWHPNFIEAINRLSIIEYQLDILLSDDRDAKLDVIREWELQKEEQLMQTDPKTPVYHETAAYAREHGELEQYWASHWTNIACKHDIEDSIAKSFDGMHLKKECVSEMLDKYGVERISLVLASTLQVKQYDGRFSPSNKEWAGTVRTPDEQTWKNHDRRDEYVVNTHPAVLDGFVSLMRKEIRERERPSVREALKAKSPRRQRCNTANPER